MPRLAKSEKHRLPKSECELGQLKLAVKVVGIFGNYAMTIVDVTI